MSFLVVDSSSSISLKLWLEKTRIDGENNAEKRFENYLENTKISIGPALR